MTKLDFIDRVRAILDAATPSTAHLEQALAEAERRASDSDARIAALIGDRRGLLLGGSRADALKHEEKIAEETFAAEQARAFAVELRAKLDQNIAAVRAAAVAAERATVEKLMEAAVKAMGMLPQITEQVRAVIRAVATADAAALAFARANPGETAIVDAESRVRRQVREPIVKRETKVWAWIDENGRFVSDEKRTTVWPDPAHPDNEPLNSRYLSKSGTLIDADFLTAFETGKLTPDPTLIFRTMRGTGARVHPVKALRRDMEIDGSFVPAALAVDVRLPALRNGDPSWKGVDFGDPAAVLRELDKPIQPTALPYSMTELVALPSAA